LVFKPITWPSSPLAGLIFGYPPENKSPELETIIVKPSEKNGWEKWGKWFTGNFIGTSEYGQDCCIKNPEVLRLRNYKKANSLTAIATAPLIIENKALGYRITYQMENFHYEFYNPLPALCWLSFFSKHGR
jgi:hypothetical protein